MIDLTFVTGNQHKADYLALWLGVPIPHRKIDIDELQSLDLAAVAEHKARQAYKTIGSPVLVEDVGLTFHGLGRLPGPFIKFFLEELGTTGLTKLGRTLDDKSATASIMYGIFDGTNYTSFIGDVYGTIVSEPRSLEGNDWSLSLSWNSVFMPDGSHKTYAEMTDQELKLFSHRAQAIIKLKEYLKTH